MDRTKLIGKGIGLGTLAIVGFLLFVYAFQYIWNITIPEIFGLRSLSYFQALCLLIISRILFGGFGFRWANSGKNKFWKERVKMKMQNMTPEEREEFKRKLSQKCKEW